MFPNTAQVLSAAGFLSTVEDDGSIVLALDDSGATIVIQRTEEAHAYYVETREANDFLAGAWLVRRQDLIVFIRRTREARALTGWTKPKWWRRRY